MIFEIRYSDSNSDSIIRFFDSNCLTLFFNSRLRVMEVSRLTSRFKTNRFFNTFFPSRLLIFENQDSNKAKTQTGFRLKSSKLPDSNARSRGSRFSSSKIGPGVVDPPIQSRPVIISFFFFTLSLFFLCSVTRVG